MKNTLRMKVQAVALAACVTLSTFDITVQAALPVEMTQTTESTNIADSIDTTDSADTAESTETADITDVSNDTDTTDNTEATDHVSTESHITTVKDNENDSSKEQTQSQDTEDTVERHMGYNSIDDFKIPSLYDGTYFPNQKGAAPSSYDSRDNGYITPVRDQGTWGTCWSFSAMGMAEANLVRKGLADNTLNLSELQLAYFFYHTVADPLGNTTGDSTNALGASYLEQGGNSVFTTFALASWTGAAIESKAPYEDATTESYALDNSLAYDDDYHMQNTYWVNMNDVADVKNMIMNYGAVATSYYSDQIGNFDTTYYNNTNRAYFYDGSYQSNHAIIFVGWDDSFSNTNFNAAHRPSSNGAWLVKNSWGTDFADSGYFWISYEDSALTNADNSKAFVFDFESADNYDHNYQYDGSSGFYSDMVLNGGSIANVFTVKGNFDGAEQIEAVSFALYDVNVDYSIQIYTNLSDSQDPTSGTAMIVTPKMGQTSYVGYYTVALDEPIVIDEGTTFSVVVTLSRSAGNYVNYFCDRTYANGNWISFTNSSQAGQSFTKPTAGSSWIDLNADNETARIKAFTSNTGVVQPSAIFLDHSAITMSTGETTTLTASITPTNANNKSVIWTSSDEGVAAVNSNGLVTAIGVGTTVITATSSNGLTATCQVAVEAVMILPTSIALNRSSITMKAGETTTLTATITPNTATDKNVTWTSSNKGVATVDSNGFVATIGVGTAVITAATSNGLTAACQITGTIGKVTGLTATSNSTTAITLKWTKQNGVSGYEIYRYNKSSKKYKKIATNRNANKNTYKNKSLKAATTYKYKVRAYTTVNGKKVYGAYSSVLTTATKTAKPTLNVKALRKSVKLTWNKVNGASGYEIYMSKSKSSGYSLVKTIKKGKTVSYTKKGLTKKKTYYFKIRSYKTVAGVKIYSSYSKIKAAKVK
jgi:C1A family cysteine protease/uncharacterized protein YjdB